MKFDMGTAWREAMAMISRNREVLLVVAGIFFFLPSVVLGFTVGDVQEAMLADPENARAVLISTYSQWSWLFALVTLVGAIGYLALLALLRDTARPTVGDAITFGMIGLLPAVGTYLVISIALGLMLAVLIAVAGAIGSGAITFALGIVATILALYVVVKLSMAGPVIAIEKAFNPFKIIARSWRLTKGNSVRLFLFYLLLFIAYFVIAIVISGILGLVTVMAGASAGLAINAIASGLISAVVTVILLAVLAAVHRQLSGPSPAAISETFK